uniref:G_PROTEIN_RECEP_F1_2 domain-containing protein n=1 Tax=Angiostrongylus cantonensis TaxID=6313 RepID=A0A0K0DLV9_ANGCA
LAALLTITDFLHAVTSKSFCLTLNVPKKFIAHFALFSALPYTMYLIISWNPVHFSLSSYCVMIFSIPVVIQLKINLTLTISIAVERTLMLHKNRIRAKHGILQAMYFPVVFRNLSSHSYAIFSLMFGFLLATLDLVLEFSLTPFNDSPNCTSVGCFLSDNFRYYWGISNMVNFLFKVMGIVVIVLMTSILIKLRTLQQKPGPLRAVKLRSNRFKQANRRSVGILFISLISVTVPSVVAGLAKAIGIHVFNVVGPFYIAGLLCAGACNSVLCLALNKEMQEAVKKFITCKGPSLSENVTTVRALMKV